MAANLWRVYSAAAPTTAAMTRTATGTAIKTFIQITPSIDIVVVGWGVAFETAPTTFVNAELVVTGTVAGGTPTSVTAQNFQGSTASPTSAVGILPTSEGTVTTTEVLDNPLLLTNYYKWENSLGREPIVEAGQVLRVRLTTATTINALAWIDFE